MTRTGAWQRLPEDAKRLFGVELTNGQVVKFGRFLDLVEAWSARMNLVGRASREDLIERHLLDSLAPAQLLGAAKTVADFGSGAGFPAIPLAIVRPDIELHLVESRRKRCSFLRHVSRTLGLANVSVSENRGEEWNPPEDIGVVIGRALAATTLAALTDRVLSADGRLIVMRKQGAEGRLEGFEQIAVEGYRLPGGERHEVAAYARAR